MDTSKLRTLWRGLAGAVTLVGLLVPSLAAAEAALDEPGDCSGIGPLVSAPLGSSEEWRLPISPLRPDVMTEARVRVEVVRDDAEGRLKAWVHFTFPDPKPLGIPFTFQKAQLTWEDRGQTHSAQLDWSDECTGPGRSLFPRQAWSASFDLNEDTAAIDLERAVFTLFGSRN